MRETASLFALMSLFVVMASCGHGSKALKPAGTSPPATEARASAERPDLSKADPITDQSGKKSKAAPPIDPSSGPLPDNSKLLSGGDGLGQRAEVNQAALEFAENVPNVKVVKTCFSKLYGGWQLFLYVGKAKKTSLQQFSWDPKAKEWEIVLHEKEIPEDQLEYQINVEVGDEKCFVLKK